MESQNNWNQGQNGQIITWDIAHQLITSSSCYRQILGGCWDNLNGSGSTTSIVSTFYHPPPQTSLYGSGSDPHLTSLRLGKRHYFEDGATDLGVGGWASNAAGKKGKAACGGGGGVPRCQVEGCGVALVSAKDYHKRRKVCEMHAKAPTVVVLGLVQRFCQQCSRFHAVSEFDDAKRSCRRRLAGHNERRRKSSQSQGMGRALSRLSSKADSWVQPCDLSVRSRAALHELIAEHRATILARQPIYDEESSSRYHVVGIGEGEAQPPGSSSLGLQCTHHMLDEPTSWELGLLEIRTHETLDLMQAPTPRSTLGMLSVRENGNGKEEESYEMWSSFEGAHVV